VTGINQQFPVCPMNQRLAGFNLRSIRYKPENSFIAGFQEFHVELDVLQFVHLRVIPPGEENGRMFAGGYFIRMSRYGPVNDVSGCVRLPQNRRPVKRSMQEQSKENGKENTAPVIEPGVQESSGFHG